MSTASEFATSVTQIANVGVRYTLNVPSTEADDQVAVFNLTTRPARGREFFL